MIYWFKILAFLLAPLLVAGEAVIDFRRLTFVGDNAAAHRLEEISRAMEGSAAPKPEVSNSNAVIPACFRKHGMKFALSQYWIPKEGQWDETKDSQRVFLGEDGQPMSIFDTLGQAIANVSEGMMGNCQADHTCLLADGSLIHLKQINREQDRAIFEVIGRPGRQRNLFGYGSGRQNLVPYVSIAVNGLPEGTTLYIPDMDGVVLPSGQQHNGCVRVDDKRSSSPQDACHIDLFVATYVDHLMFDMRKSVTARIQPCTVENYVTKDHLAYMHADTSDAVIMQALNDTREEEDM